MTLFTYGYGHSVREVAGSGLSRGDIVRGVFHPARQLTRFSLYLAINYRPYPFPSFEVASHVQNCHSAIIIILVLLYSRFEGVTVLDISVLTLVYVYVPDFSVPGLVYQTLEFIENINKSKSH